jgi:hypothetical protein
MKKAMQFPLIKVLKETFTHLLDNLLLQLAGAGFLIIACMKFYSWIRAGVASSEQSDWQQYYSLITVLPFTAFFIYRFSGNNLVHRLKPLFAVFYVFVVFYLYWSLNSFLLGVFTFSLVYFSFRKKELVREHTFLFFIIYISFFLVISRISWWQDVGKYVWLDLFTSIVFLVSLALCIGAFVKRESFEIGPGKRALNFIKIAVACCLFFIVAMESRDMEIMELHHWSCYTGTAELLRQGGYLLWSVPSQYGFLSILSIAILPIKSCWQSFWVLQIIFLSSTSFFLFYILYSYQKSTLNWLLSIIITVCALHLFPAWAPSIFGVNSCPSVGPYRFFWLYAIIFFIVIQSERSIIKSKSRENLCGTLLWIIGCLWSFESAYYVSAVWFSYLFLLAALPAEQTFIIRLFRNFLPSFVMLLVAITVISIFYLIRIDHLPDIYSFAEHALSFKIGFGSISIDFRGGFGLLILVLAFILADFIYCFQNTDRRNLPLLGAIYAGFWAGISYFIGRSHENNISNLMPLIIFISGALLLIAKRNGSKAYLLKIAVLQLYVLIITLTLGNKEGMQGFLSNIQKENVNIESAIPLLSSELSEAMQAAGITEKDSIVFLDNIALLKKEMNGPVYNFWLPINPSTVYNPLPVERSALYIQRFSKKYKSGGFLIIGGNEHDDHLEKIIKASFDTAGPVYRNNKISIQRFKVKNTGALVDERYDGKRRNNEQ